MKIINLLLASAGLLILHSSCEVVKKSNRLKNLKYESFKASVIAVSYFSANTTNVLDVMDLTESDSLYGLFHRIDTLWRKDLAALKKIKPTDKPSKKMIKEDVDIINQNVKNLSSFLKNKNTTPKSRCKEKECPLLAEVVKSKQLMYLYIGSELKDSFVVSTGVPGRETPSMNVKASGPVFIKYTSTKYPEGDYMGLGNMPYAVFVKGGYAIHGTTPGNFEKLGKKASHGCIRLHPDNAKLFYELVKIVGLENTWVIVR